MRVQSYPSPQLALRFGNAQPGNIFEVAKTYLNQTAAVGNRPLTVTEEGSEQAGRALLVTLREPGPFGAMTDQFRLTPKGVVRRLSPVGKLPEGHPVVPNTAPTTPPKQYLQEILSQARRIVRS